LKRILPEEIWRFIDFRQKDVIAVPRSRVTTPETIAPEQNPSIVTSCLSSCANHAQYPLNFIQISCEGSEREVPTQDPNQIVSDTAKIRKNSERIEKVSGAVLLCLLLILFITLGLVLLTLGARGWLLVLD